MVALEETSFEISTVLQDVELLMGPIADEKGLTLRIEPPTYSQPLLSGDVGKLRQILFNLVANALKFTQAGVVSVSANAQEGLGRYRFSVRDSGKGIAPDALERIFAPFEQEDAQTARHFGGTGLGLSISRRLAGLMGGSLTVESRPGEGATFHLDVGFTTRTSAPEVNLAAAQSSSNPLSLLVVEDHPVNQAVIRAYLEEMGHTMTMAVSGRAAIEAAQMGVFDAVLMDVSLPDMSGIEVTRYLREQMRIPIIGISAHVQPREIAACCEAGMVEVLAKPIVPEQLETALSSHCGRAQVARSVAGTLADLGAEQTKGLITLMLDRMDEEVPALFAAMAAGQMAHLARIAHQLKGAFGNFDMPGLVALLAAAETGAMADQAHLALRRALDRARSELRHSLGALELAGFMPAVQ